MIIALVELAISSRPGEDDERKRHHDDPTKETCKTCRIGRKRPAPVRDRSRLETEGKRERGIVRRAIGGTKKTIK